MCGRHGSHRAQIEAPHLDPDVVDLGVLCTGLDALHLVVKAEHGCEAESCCGDREHAGAGAEVDQRAGRLLGRGELEQKLQAKAGAVVGACAERLAGIDHDLLDGTTAI